MKKVYLVDVSSLFFRSFYAIRSLNNSKGLPTNAIYGFVVAITKLLREHKPDLIAFCFDRPDEGFREKIYPEYKANRSEPPEDLIKQFPYLPKIAEAFCIASFDCAGYEADDIIGTLATLAKKSGQEVTIVSGDKDFAQLVEPGIRIYDPAKDLYMGTDEVRGKFGVLPEQVIDYLALVGDTSDNVPGVNGVGPKAAQKLLGEFGTLENIFANLEAIKNERLRELLSTQKDQALVSKKLVTIVKDVPMDYTEDKLLRRPPDMDKLVPLLNEFEFKTLLQKFIGDQDRGSESSSTSIEIKNVKTEKSAGTEWGELKKVDSAGELNSLLHQKVLDSHSLWIDASPSGLAFGCGAELVQFTGGLDEVSRWLGELLKEAPVKLSGFDTKAIAHFLKIPEGVPFQIQNDPLLSAYCLGHEGEMELPSLVRLHLEKSFPELATPGERLSLAYELNEVLSEKVKSQDVDYVLRKIEMPLVPVLFRMESHGVLIDKDLLLAYSKELKAQIKEVEEDIFRIVGQTFNVGSPKQLAQILFDKLDLPVIRKTKTGFSTDSDVLEKLRDKHPVPEKILTWRELSKLNSTYVEALPQLINTVTGRVHTNYNQTMTSTGRLSSVHPNLQNIPIRTPRGQRIRNSFIAPEGFEILSADYSQIELRILAHITGDKALVEAFERDLDIHSATASEIFSVSIESVNADQRRTAKAINFGIVYGMSEFGLAENLQIDRKTAADFIKRYFEKYPGVKKYMQDVVLAGSESGFVKTLFGRKRHYPGLKSTNKNIKQMAERAAINMPIQGTAADLIKLAMIRADEFILSSGSQVKMVMQVHDELVFEVPQSELKQTREKIAQWMGQVAQFNVPLKVDFESGPHWS